MAHRIYETEAFVLGGVGVGEANRFITLFTSDLGVVRAVARSVRVERSKLRYALQNHMLSDVALVRGKDTWRLTGAVPRLSYSSLLREERAKRALLLRITALIRRLHGEERHPYAYASLRELLDTLLANEADAFLVEVEVLAALRLLYALGYVSGEGKTARYIADSGYGRAILEEMRADQKEMLEFVNQALAASRV